MGNFPHLKKLNLSNKDDNLGINAIGDKGIPFLKKFTTLEELNLSSNKITSKGLQCLSMGNFPHLKKLNLGNKDDNSDHNAFDDEGIPFLKNFTTLEQLNLLSDNKITDKGVQFLW